jgi:hypothetical protein
MSCIEVESLVGKRNMITAFNMCFLINIERECQSTVALQSGTLFVARQRLGEITLAGLRGIASHLLLLSLAFASDENFVGASFVLLASSRSVADGLVWVITSLFGLAAGLLTRSTPSIFTLAFSVTRLGAEVRAAFELSATDLIVHMTIVLHLRMPASLGTVALEAAWWRLSTTG